MIYPNHLICAMVCTNRRQAWIANKAGETAEAAEKMESVAQLAALAPLKAKVDLGPWGRPLRR